MGFHWPKEIACIINGERVTYAELKKAKSERQRRRLQSILENVESVRHAAYVWVFYQPGLFGFAYQGYWLAIRTLKHCWTFEFRHEPTGDRVKTIDVMAMFPCGCLPLVENFEKWKERFVKRYRRPGRFSKQGLVAVWIECDYEGGWPVRIEPCHVDLPKSGERRR
jgi:hypothetical protein